MLDLIHWYARAHGPRAVRVIHDALTEEAARHADEALSDVPSFEEPSDAHAPEEPSDAYSGSCSVPAVD